MAYLTINNIKISGVAACVQKRVEENVNLPFFADRAEAEKAIAFTGIARKRVSEKGVTSSDLAVPAVERMLADLGWGADSVDCLFFVSMTRDYIAPQTACILQNSRGAVGRLENGFSAIHRDTNVGILDDNICGMMHFSEWLSILTNIGIQANTTAVEASKKQRGLFFPSRGMGK